jgi:hypothetical protein
MFNYKSEEVLEIKTYKTKDYGRFKKIVGNRPVTEKGVRELVRKMKGKGENAMYHHSIVVNNYDQIIDGQHRLEAAKRLGIYVFYTVIVGATIQTVKESNAQVHWTTSDETNCFVEQGNSEYIVLKQFASHYKIGHGIAQSLLSGSTTHEGVRNIRAFKAGEFKVTSLSEATAIMEMVVVLSQFYTETSKRAFIMAIQRLFYMSGFNFQRLLRKFQTGSKLEHCTTAVNYLRKLQQMYNYCERQKVHFLPAE